ncbi:hypothetical protein [Streptosporangium sandarakinum]|uniref:hypothetical protein n=1 Tax=Streptosporangium sandarakinum TaxID=1260955 RepID=UPI003718E262
MSRKGRLAIGIALLLTGLAVAGVVVLFGWELADQVGGVVAAVTSLAGLWIAMAGRSSSPRRPAGSEPTEPEPSPSAGPSPSRSAPTPVKLRRGLPWQMYAALACVVLTSPLAVVGGREAIGSGGDYFVEFSGEEEPLYFLVAVAVMLISMLVFITILGEAVRLSLEPVADVIGGTLIEVFVVVLVIGGLGIAFFQPLGIVHLLQDWWSQPRKTVIPFAIFGQLGIAALAWSWHKEGRRRIPPSETEAGG